jgi:putative ATP-dependent endonuclease of the OLD family
VQIALLSIENFRCYREITDISFNQLTAFLGANDAGKTSLGRAIEILITSEKPIASDFCVTESGVTAKEIVIKASFDIDENSPIHQKFSVKEKGNLQFKKEFDRNLHQKTFIYGKKFMDERFYDFENSVADIQSELLRNINIDPGPNKSTRIAQFQSAKSSDLIPYDFDWTEIKFDEIQEFLPIFDKVSSYEYKNPELFVQGILRQNIGDAFMEGEGDEKELISELKHVENKVRQKLNEKVERMTEFLQKMVPELVSVEVEPNFDFSKGVTSNTLLLKIGDQMRSVSTFGEGIKKKVWMGLLEWQISSSENVFSRQIIRVYDEPDVNLDYKSERKLVASIVEATLTKNLFQAILFTHSVALIDFLPMKSLRLVNVEHSGERKIDWIFDSDEDDTEFEHFLNNMTSNLGLKNSEVFFERAFIFVEGDTEYNALPILYSKIYQRSIKLDGIVIIDLESCGAWSAVMKAVIRSKSGKTLLFLDSDCTTDGSSARVLKRATELGLNANWINNHVFYVGQKEFEDAFDSEFIADFLNDVYGKEESAWTSAEITNLKNTSVKFSTDLLRELQSNARKNKRSDVSKPHFGRSLAEYYSEKYEMPQTIQKMFVRIREIAGIEI